MSLLDTGYTDKVLGEAKNQMLMRGLESSKELTESRQVIAHQERRAQLLKQESMQDHLTGLSNRKQFDLTIEEEFVHARKNKWPLSAIFVDLDKFKQINDRCGHAVGDQVLRFSAKILDASTRDQDAIFRFGGEEFVILLPGCTVKDATTAANRIVNALQNSNYTLNDHSQISVTGSAGVATMDEHHTFNSPNQLVEAADQAMYQAKQRGGSQVIVYQENLEMSG